ncbi:DUF7684 family protein [Hyphococcus aureus]|uniref:DUF7684 family protein n=1 Tax=Hyphococcus aureus TaxID=2666033 RepID=UPI003D9C21FA
MIQNVEYIHLPTGTLPPDLRGSAFRCVVIIQESVSIEWRDLISSWLVYGGCLYMMAWGNDCILWDDSVDYANLERFNFQEIPEEQFVLTTWHSEETLDEVFWFSKNCAHHSIIELKRTILIDINKQDRRTEIVTAYDDTK